MVPRAPSTFYIGKPSAFKRRKEQEDGRKEEEIQHGLICVFILENKNTAIEGLG